MNERSNLATGYWLLVAGFWLKADSRQLTAFETVEKTPLGRF